MIHMKKIFIIIGLLVCSLLYAQKPAYNKELIPSPVFDKEPGYVDLYWTAWQQAYDHIKYQPGLVQPLYMDEGLWDDTIWIWDSEFMVMYCKYAPKLYPGIQTLDNFYYTMLENQGSSLRIQHPDNPPFYAWVEAEYYKLTGDKDHLKELIRDKRFLQRYFDLFDTLCPEMRLQFDHYPMALRKKEFGYNWNGISSGMDNTPRTRAHDILWVDAISQQALSALYIVRLAEEVGDKKTAKVFQKKYDELKKLINEYYWDEEDGCYYDIYEKDNKVTKILSPASFWPVLAEIPSKNQVEKMLEFTLQDTKLGGEIPMVTISRDDPEFHAGHGEYWKGAVWLPTSYMAIKAIEKYGFLDIANKTAENILKHMLATYVKYEPHTIWECYSPSEPAPSRYSSGGRVREDFCGWSALGPISLFIENILGFYDIDARNRTISWNLHNDCRHGINNLTFGDITTDIIYEDNVVRVKTNQPYTLIINHKKFKIDSDETINL